MDEATKEFFRRQQNLEPANQVCADCNTLSPQWASVSHGCYISLEASGVHRSLGVHISFVRSITMDSWKPMQLRMMELGGNKRLKEFFRHHGVADDMPITEKYNTRAADWYRRNLRAEAEGGLAPAPLEEGTGHLPLNDTPSTAQVAYASASMSMAASGSSSSSAGADASSMLQPGQGSSVVGSMTAGSPSSSSSAPPRKVMTGFGSDTIGRGMKMEGFGNEAFDDGRSSSRSSGHGGDRGDLLSSIVGDNEVTRRVSGKVTASWRAVGVFAGMAKSFAERKVEEVQKEGWLDAAVDATKQGVGAAVETTQWAAQKSVEAGKATYSYVQDGSGKAFGSTAKTASSFMESLIDGFNDTLADAVGIETATSSSSPSPGNRRAEGMSSALQSPAPTVPAGQDFPDQPKQIPGDLDEDVIVPDDVDSQFVFVEKQENESIGRDTNGSLPSPTLGEGDVGTSGLQKDGASPEHPEVSSMAPSPLMEASSGVLDPAPSAPEETLPQQQQQPQPPALNPFEDDYVDSLIDKKHMVEQQHPVNQSLAASPADIATLPLVEAAPSSATAAQAEVTDDAINS